MRILLLASVLAVAAPAIAVKEHDFKKCSQSGFCRRGRALAERAENATSSWTSPYSIDASSVNVVSDRAVLKAPVKSSLYPDIKFGLEVRVHEDGVVRVRMDEEGGIKQRYDGAADWALIQKPIISSTVKWNVGKKDAKATVGDSEIQVSFSPLRISMLRGGKEQVVLNGKGLLHMEHFRIKPNPPPAEESTEGEAQTEGEQAQKVMEAPKTKPNAWFEGEDEDAYWEEQFGQWSDSKPKGPESLSLDITFPNHGHLYGIPQHASPLDLPETRGPKAHYPDPYRLWNSDVFEYGADSTISLYGSIPILHAHSADSTVAVFNAVGSETFIDVLHPTAGSTETHWISESGVMDVFLIPGPTPNDIFKRYAGLTGTTPLPPLWSIAYHQCRWNYVSSEDVRNVQKRFDDEDMPVDVFWLDIDYAPDHKYFIWKEKEFPDPIEMAHDVAVNQRKMVVIIDPHLKRSADFPPYAEASSKGLLVRTKDNAEYEGWCWPGSSAWVDFFNPASSEWWSKLFSTTASLDGSFTWTQSSTDIHIWNDMNEPSVFNGPEISMQRDNLHHAGWEHRDVHNINGMLFTNATWNGVLKRSGGTQRPFVLTRSFFAGSQRFGAMWTGDNLGTWEHMAVGIKMVLSNNIAGFTFSGSDVGGFFGNPDPEMLVRWYQVGIFNPFFRAHAHIDTKRREPYLLDQPYKGMVKDILRLRYALLPVWYTAFREASVTGVPVLRPHYVVFPQDEAGFSLDDQFFVGGSGILVKPITEKGLEETQVYIPEDKPYYDYFSHAIYRGAKKGAHVTVSAPLAKTPVLIRGGSIIPTRERPRRSARLMLHDPLTLTIALDKDSAATGELYLDAGDGYAYKDGAFVWRSFTASKHGQGVRISSVDLAAKDPASAVEGGALAKYDPTKNEYAKEVTSVGVERIVVLGMVKAPSSVRVEGGAEVPFTFEVGVPASGSKSGTASKLVIKRPDVGVVSDWSIVVA